MPDINQIRDYVINDKPINSSSAKDWLRYLLQQLDEQNASIRHELDKALARADYSLAHVIECFLNHHKEESK